MFLVWGLKPARITVWWLMTVVAAVGVSLALFAWHPLLWMVALQLSVVAAVVMMLMEGPDQRKERRP
jgi:hypothetical protein